ncbi:unnamed protein product [Rotaria magnacalcarata]|uniref:CCHC-type domain-containing protein n=1 Tax=Rotaria magnacalcarata TaxID=392030 RepID=A0A814XHZ3_9BILA|nr:unnamed protein product [Rotaria magnacalcarata]CAF1211388.1 unnamed protein product [Rotaria magnacalcarata]CAF1914140.1 unnamed protein product [Rotaria magnacalcarata]CAF3746360.1 unnamed protein product [Rotaria magnacalcarata]CAF3798314.1 unnamed protein product [Rotaria magnacalcarata]
MAKYHLKGYKGHNINQNNCNMVDNLIGDQNYDDHSEQQCQCTHSCYDPSSKIYFMSNSNKKKRVPPPSTTNMELVNSPAYSLRRSHSNMSDDDDFQIVTHKRSKQVNHPMTHSIRSQETHRQQQVITEENDNVIHNAPSPVTSDSIMINNNINNNIDYQQQNITSASTRFALTRYPFPPLIVCFNVNTISINKFKEEIINHVKTTYQTDITIVNCRTSNLKCNNNEVDCLLYLKDATSFAFLLDKNKWSMKIVGEDYAFPSSPSIPPQLSLIIKNVDLNIDLDEFTSEVKTVYPAVNNVIRMKNKFDNNIKLVKIELTSYEIRQQLLANKKLIITSISYDIDQYLAPINVLICSKCCGLGHFRKQCTELTETCRTCSEKFTDLKDHRCTASPKCKHCNGDHTSNFMKCPVVKSFLADLTREILSNSNNINRPLLPTASTKSDNGFHFNPPDFPALNKGWSQSDSPMMSKLNDLITGLANVNTTLSKLYETNTKFENLWQIKIFMISNYEKKLNRLNCITQS